MTANIPNNSLPRVVSFRTKKHAPWEPVIQHTIKHNGMYEVVFCTDWDAVTEAISIPTDLILFHCKMLALNNLSAAEVVNMISSIAQYTTGKVAKIAVVLDNDTPAVRIKELRKTEVCGIVPNSEQWGTGVGNAAVISILTHGSHWPKDIIASLPGAALTLSTKKSNILPKLTTRQQQVSDLVCRRGLSNKQIANTLKISESTVKIHVSAVMKTYGVRNRTQLVLAIGAALRP